MDFNLLANLLKLHISEDKVSRIIVESHETKISQYAKVNFVSFNKVFFIHEVK